MCWTCGEKLDKREESGGVDFCVQDVTVSPPFVRVFQRKEKKIECGLLLRASNLPVVVFVSDGLEMASVLGWKLVEKGDEQRGQGVYVYVCVR